MHAYLVAIVVSVSAASLSGQTPAQAPNRQTDLTAAISGVVVDATSGEPVENASVTIDGANVKGLAQQRQITDAKGRFVFVNLPPGSDYAVNAAAPGFFNAGLTRGTSILDTRQLVTVKAGEWVRDLQIRMMKPGSISGRVLDEASEPVVGVFVRALKRVPVAGREQLVNVSTGTTDDRGMYRISGLDAGRYFVEVPSVQGATPPSAGPSMPSEFVGTPASYPGSAAPSSASAEHRARVYPIAFYPAARAVNEASTIDVSLGEERAGADIALAPVSGFAVNGRLVGHFEGLTLRLMPTGLEVLGNGSEAAQSPIGADGAFAFDNVPAGNYVLVAGRRVSEMVGTLATGSRSLPSPASTQGWSGSTIAVASVPLGVMLSHKQFGNNPTTQGQPSGSAFARMPLNVSSDIAGLLVTLRDGAVMEAAVQFDAAPNSKTTKPTLAQVPLSLDATNGDPDLGIIYPKFTDKILRIEGIGPGEYWLRVASADWVVKQILWNGEDYTARPFDAATKSAFPGVTVVLTDRVSSVAGTVKDKNAAVVLFPADRTLWTGVGFNPTLIKTTLADENGQFTLKPFPAGDYCVLAVPREERRDWLEPGYFERAVAVATRVTLGWGDQRAMSLSIVRVPR